MNTNNQTPLISIIVNCFNGEKYLQKALKSIQNQTYKNWEVIFWDNLSTDKSKNIFFSYSDKRFKYYLAKKHTNLYSARNLAVKKAKGKYLAFLDVDDWWDKNKLALQMPYFDDKKVALVYGNCWIVDQRKKKTVYIYSKKKLPSGFISKRIIKNYPVCLGSIVIKKSLFKRKLFDDNYHIIGDFDLVIRTSFKHKIECCQTPIVFNRFHKSNESLIKFDLQTKELENWQLKKEIKKRLTLEDKQFLKNLINFRKGYNSIKKDTKKSIMYLKLMTFNFLKIKLFIKIIFHLINKMSSNK